MDGEACPAGGCGTCSFVPGSFSDRQRSGRNCQFRPHFHNLNFQNLKDVSRESFLFTSFTFRSWRKSRTKCVIERYWKLASWSRWPMLIALIRLHPRWQEFRVFSLSISADQRGSAQISADQCGSARISHFLNQLSWFWPIFHVNLYFSMVFIDFSMVFIDLLMVFIDFSMVVIDFQVFTEFAM